MLFEGFGFRPEIRLQTELKTLFQALQTGFQLLVTGSWRIMLEQLPVPVIDQKEGDALDAARLGRRFVGIEPLLSVAAGMCHQHLPHG